MQLSCSGANIVLLADSHNPSIVSPGWLQENELVDEEPEKFVHTPVFSMFQSQSFQLILDQQRLQLALRSLNEANLRRLQAAATKYLRLLPHISYASIGLNFIWTAQAEQSSEGFNLTENRFLSETGKSWCKRLFKQVRVGSILYNFTESYRLRVVVEPLLTTDGNLTLDFNYHFDLERGKEITAVDQLLECYKNSEQAAHSLLRPELS